MEKGKVINLCGGVYKVLLEDNSIIQVKARAKLRSEKQYVVNKKSQSKKAQMKIGRASCRERV